MSAEERAYALIRRLGAEDLEALVSWLESIRDMDRELVYHICMVLGYAHGVLARARRDAP